MERQERPQLAEIREKLAQWNGIQKREFLDCDTVPRGVPRGVICEITGSARTEWIISLLKQNPQLQTFWIEEQLTILPTAIQQRGVDLSKILIAEAGDRLFQALRKAIRSKLFDCVVLPGAIDEVKMLKALQLFARESNATVFFLSKIPMQAWAIPFQLSANWNWSVAEDSNSFRDTGSPQYSVEVLKSKWGRSESL
jgi:hypothetical protein